jgi:anaerobic carbon-monoxide dehydrogenase iron sulfur subunit
MSKILMIHPDKCTGCHNCELACSFSHEGEFRNRASRVHVYSWEREGFSVAMMCQQCDEAACVSVCMPGAMHRDPETGRVEWDKEKCIGCKMCVQACPFGNAVYDAKTKKIFKCDTCGGNPECVTFCPNHALEWVDDNVATRSRKKAFAQKFKDAFTEVGK